MNRTLSRQDVIEANFDMVNKACRKSGISAYVMLKLSFIYAKVPVPEHLEKNYTELAVNHKIPEELVNFCLDYLSGRINIRHGINPQSGAKMLWVSKNS